jgi:hypothetical protein
VATQPGALLAITPGPGTPAGDTVPPPVTIFRTHEHLSSQHTLIARTEHSQACAGKTSLLPHTLPLSQPGSDCCDWWERDRGDTRAGACQLRPTTTTAYCTALSKKNCAFVGTHNKFRDGNMCIRSICLLFLRILVPEEGKLGARKSAYKLIDLIPRPPTERCLNKTDIFRYKFSHHINEKQ